MCLRDRVRFVMDVFTLRVWARALKGSTAITTANAFESILEEAGAKPVELNTDGGGEFSSSFSKMLERQGINHIVKPTPDSRNDIATLDSAMGTIKQALEKEKKKRQYKRRTISPKYSTKSLEDTTRRHILI